MLPRKRNIHLAIIVAVDKNFAIGKDGGLLCHLSADLRHFKSLTMGHSIIMGRKTFESLPNGALPGRENIVVTRNPGYVAQGAKVAHSLDEAFLLATHPGEVFVIGGAEIYKEALPKAEILHLTHIEHAFDGPDTFFPQLNANEWELVEKEPFTADAKNPYAYTFRTLRRVNAEE
ncbi:MAG: dihydrofolate reductase [Muribaculaceae bacterium]|nr:dihydrofolate reductase [Muribaculaceae bacterium]